MLAQLLRHGLYGIFCFLCGQVLAQGWVLKQLIPAFSSMMAKLCALVIQLIMLIAQAVGNFFALMVTTVVVVQLVLLLLDLVWAVTKMARLTWPAKSWAWMTFCFMVWFGILGSCICIAKHFVETPLVLVAWAQGSLLNRCYASITGILMGPQAQSELLSYRCQRAYTQQHELLQVTERNSPKKKWRNCLCICALMTVYIATRLEDFQRAGWWNLLLFFSVLRLHVHSYWSKDRRSLREVWTYLWSISPEPVHAGFVLSDGTLDDDYGGSYDTCRDECSAHEVCAVCLESLCSDIVAVGNASLSILRRRHSALSIQRWRPRASLVGLSAMRAWGSQSYKGSLTGLARRISELPCGHKFHLGCIDDVVQHGGRRLQCPTCRSTLGNAWEDFTEKERLSMYLGWAAACVLILVLRS